MKKVLCLLLSVCMLTFMCTPFASAKENLGQDGISQNIRLVERNTREEENGTVVVDYDMVLVPDNSNSAQLNSYPVVTGTLSIGAVPINSYTREFQITVRVVGTTISKCFVTLDTGDDVNLGLSAHPAGISNTAYLNAQYRYPYSGRYTATVTAVTVYTLSGGILYDLLGTGSVSFNISQGYAD